MTTLNDSVIGQTIQVIKRKIVIEDDEEESKEEEISYCKVINEVKLDTSAS